MKLLVILLTATTMLYEQDTISSKSYLNLGGIAYSFWLINGAIVNLEYGFDQKNSISIGVKGSFYTDFAGFQTATSEMLLIDYKRFFKTGDNKYLFISPYSKIRKMKFYEYEGGGGYKEYHDKSICLGVYGGFRSFSGKRKRFTITSFCGGGYFIQ